MLAPVLVPMLMMLGISPEMTTAAYRMGDSVTNPITPLMVYFPLVLTFCQRWIRSSAWALSSPRCCPTRSPSSPLAWC